MRGQQTCPLDNIYFNNMLKHVNSNLGRQHTIISLLIYLLTGICKLTLNVDQLIGFWIFDAEFFFPTALTLKH